MSRGYETPILGFSSRRQKGVTFCRAALPDGEKDE
jgi:hypothetical protein